MRRHQVPYTLITETAQLDAEVARWQTNAAVLAVDTETAHWHQVQGGKSCISLLQVWDGTSEDVQVIDCFQVELDSFIIGIMANPAISKLIHNASYDLAYLGGPETAASVICTLKMARSIPNELRNGLERNSLKALSLHFLGIDLDKSYQASNWAIRPLSRNQLAYAALDPWATYRIWQEMRLLLDRPATGELVLGTPPRDPGS